MRRSTIRVCLYGLAQPALIVPTPTGVQYYNQTHGVCCLQDEMEGFIVPVGDELLHEAICALFPEGHYDDMDRATAEKIEKLLQRSPDTAGILVDWSRLSHSHEAWLHVVLNNVPPDHAGLDHQAAVLTWANSD